MTCAQPLGFEAADHLDIAARCGHCVLLLEGGSFMLEVNIAWNEVHLQYYLSNIGGLPVYLHITSYNISFSKGVFEPSKQIGSESEGDFKYTFKNTLWVIGNPIMSYNKPAQTNI